MKFKDLEEGSIFSFEGANYMKFHGDNGRGCFMVRGFLANNHPENVKNDSEVKKQADTLLEFENNQK